MYGRPSPTRIAADPLRCLPAPKLLKAMSCFGSSAGPIKLGRCDHSATHRFSVALLQKQQGDFAIAQDIKKTPEWSGDWNIMNGREVRFGDLFVVKPKHSGQWSATSESLWNNHIELRWVEVGELEQR
jgi:hypothetical protein